MEARPQQDLLILLSFFFSYKIHHRLIEVVPHNVFWTKVWRELRQMSDFVRYADSIAFRFTCVIARSLIRIKLVFLP